MEIISGPSSTVITASGAKSSYTSVASRSCSLQTLPTTFRTPAECNRLWNVTTVLSTWSAASESGQINYTPSSGVDQNVFSYRFMPYNKALEQTDNISPYPTRTIAEHQSCLPLITSSACPFEYVDSECPDGWKASSRGSAYGTSTDFCCPNQSEFQYLISSGPQYSPAFYCLGLPYTTSGGQRMRAAGIHTTYFAPAIEVYRLATLTLSSDPTPIPTPQKGGTSSQAADSPANTHIISLPVEVKAGIGIGTSMGVLSICAILAWWILRRRTREKTRSAEDVAGWGKAELDTTALDTAKGKTELEVHEVHEMDGSTTQPVEMSIAPEAVRAVEVEALRGLEVEAPRGVEVEAPRGVEVEAAGSVRNADT